MKTMSKKITHISLLFCCISTVQMFAGTYPSGTRLWDIVNNMFAPASFSSSTISVPGSYTLTNNMTGPFAINGSGVTLDLNGQTIFGVVTITGDNLTLENGVIIAPAPNSDVAPVAALTVNTTLVGIILKNLTVYTSGTIIMSPGRDGVDIMGTSSVTTSNIQVINCNITGEDGDLGMNGGNALSVTNASNVIIQGGFLTGGDGGGDPMITGFGGDGGSAITTAMVAMPAVGSTIARGGRGGAGKHVGGKGGSGIHHIHSSNFISSNNLTISGGDGGFGSDTNGGDGGNGIFLDDYSSKFCNY